MESIDFGRSFQWHCELVRCELRNININGGYAPSAGPGEDVFRGGRLIDTVDEDDTASAAFFGLGIVLRRRRRRDDRTAASITGGNRNSCS